MPQSRTGLFDDLVPPTSTSFAGGSPPRRGSLGGGVPPTSTSLASGHVALPRHAARPAHGPKGHPSGAKVTSFFDGPGITHGPSTPPRNGGGLAAGLRAVHEARLSADDILVRDAVHRLDQATKHGRVLPPNPALANVPQDWFLRLGLGFNQDAFQNGVNDPPHGVDLVKGGNLPYPQALQKVRDRTGLSNFRMTKTPSQVEQAQTHALGASADVGKTVGFKKGQTDAQTPRGLAQKNRLEANTVDPATGERVTPSSRVRQAVNGYAKGGTETLNGLGLPPLVSDLLVGTALHPLDVGADLQTAGDPRESRDHALGGVANVAGKVALDLAGGQAAQAIGKGGGLLVGSATKGIVAGLKHTGVWDAIAKAGYPEAAARVLRSRLGMSPERATRTVQAVQASGENVRWKAGTKSAAKALTEESQDAAAASKALGTRTTLRTPEGLKPPQKPLAAPRVCDTPSRKWPRT